MSAFTPFTEDLFTPASLAAALLGPGSGIAIVPDSTSLLYGLGFPDGKSNAVSSVSFYDGSLTALGIGAGVLLTSGDGMPPLSNSYGSYTSYLEPSYSDDALYAAVLAGFPGAGSVQDVSALQFSFTVTHSGYSGVRFDLVFGSDEYPEFSDSSFVDIAAVWVNGVNYALFDDKADQPLSITEKNLAAGGFIDNASGVLPIEYDGVSRVLTVVAPVHQGQNTLRIAIGDTGDDAYDSGLFVSNLRAVTYGDGGLATPFIGTTGSDYQEGTEFRDLFTMGMGNDTVKGLGGDDVIDGGDGIDTAVYSGLRGNHAITIADDGKAAVKDLAGLEGLDTLYDVERLAFSDLRVAIDLDGNAGQAYRVYKAAFDREPDLGGLSYWIHQLDLGNSMLDAATGFLQSGEFKAKYGAEPTAEEYVLALYENVLGRNPDLSGFDYWVAVLKGEPWNGTYYGQTTAEQVLVDFSESKENVANVLPLINQGITYELWVA